MLFRTSLSDNSDIPVLCHSAECLDSCFAFHDFHLLFTETAKEDCKLIYKDSQPNAPSFRGTCRQELAGGE